jgi:hypothetical protein
LIGLTIKTTDDDGFMKFVQEVGSGYRPGLTIFVQGNVRKDSFRHENEFIPAGTTDPSLNVHRQGRVTGPIDGGVTA